MREFLWDLWENLEKEYKIYRFTKEKKEEISLIIDRTFFLRVKHLHCHKRRKKKKKLAFQRYRGFSRRYTMPATCPTSVLAGTTALGCSRVSFNEFLPSQPISRPSISLEDVIKRNVTRKFSGALRPGSDHCTYPRFIAVCTTHFARPPSIAARSRSAGYSRRSCHSIVSNLRS